MVLTVHILTGAVIAAKTQNPILGLLFAFLSHYLVDTIPHEEYRIQNIQGGQWKNSFKDFLKIFLDILVGFFLAIALSKNYFAVLGGFSALSTNSIKKPIGLKTMKKSTKKSPFFGKF